MEGPECGRLRPQARPPTGHRCETVSASRATARQEIAGVSREGQSRKRSGFGAAGRADGFGIGPQGRELSEKGQRPLGAVPSPDRRISPWGRAGRHDDGAVFPLLLPRGALCSRRRQARRTAVADRRTRDRKVSDRDRSAPDASPITGAPPPAQPSFASPERRPIPDAPPPPPCERRCQRRRACVERRGRAAAAGACPGRARTTRCGGRLPRVQSGDGWSSGCFSSRG